MKKPWTLYPWMIEKKLGKELIMESIMEKREELKGKRVPISKILRPQDAFPPLLIEELLRLKKLDANWTEWNYSEENPQEYIARIKPGISTFINKLATDGASIFSLRSTSEWLFHGPKIFRPSPVQIEALEQIEVNLTVADYSQPYPALMVTDLNIGPFDSVLVYTEPGLIVATVLSRAFEHAYDITTTIASRDGRLIEESLGRFEPDCSLEGAIAHRALRVALNSCLALSNFGSHLSYLLPKELENDRKLGREHSERGLKARKRIALAVQVATFSQEITLHRVGSSQPRPEGEGSPTGRAMPPHWRRGHWRMQPWGPKNCFRKRVLIPPVMIRKDLFMGDASDTQVSIRS